MNTKARYASAPFLAGAVSLVAWIAAVSIHPIFSALAVSGLVPVFVAGVERTVGDKVPGARQGGVLMFIDPPRMMCLHAAAQLGR
jgi:hypothetical protein